MIKLYYCNIRNFGDALNPILIERLLMRPCEFRSKFSAKLCGIGSILEKLTKPCLKNTLRNLWAPPLNVWSSGFMAPQARKESFGHRQIRFWALRGMLSLRRVEALINTKLDVPVGDGGLLMSLLLEKKPPKEYAVGWIPHVADQGHPFFKTAESVIPRSTLIDLSGDPLKVLDQIARCDCIFSTAMHGLIAADALGIPNQWVEVSDNVQGGGYKFRDYYSVYDIQAPQPFVITEGVKITTAMVDACCAQYAVSAVKVREIQEKLLKALRDIPLAACE